MKRIINRLKSSNKMALKESDRILETLKSTLEIHGGKDGKEWKRRGEKVYREWLEDGWIQSSDGIPIEGEPGRILETLKRRIKKVEEKWRKEGEPNKGKLKGVMEEARLEEKIVLAMLVKLKNIWEEGQNKDKKKEEVIKLQLYPVLPSAPPPYGTPKVMAPVLDIVGEVKYHKRPDDEEGEQWVRVNDMGKWRQEVAVLLEAAKAIQKVVSNLTRISTDATSMSLTGGSESGELVQQEWTQMDQEEGERERMVIEKNRRKLKEMEEEVRRGAEQLQEMEKTRRDLSEERKKGSRVSTPPRRYRTPTPPRGHFIDLGEQEEPVEQERSDLKVLCGKFEGNVWDPCDAPAHHTRARTREQETRGQYPMRDTPGGGAIYKPWAHRDIQTLVDVLPTPEESGDRWVKAFESLTAADELTLGDMAAVMNRCMGDQECREIMTQGGVRGMVASATRFDQHRGQIWDAIRCKYPTQPRPQLMKTLTLDGEESVPVYMKKAKNLWRQAWNEEPGKETTKYLFLASCLEGLPEQVRLECEKMVGITAKSVLEFTDIVQHHVERWREGKRKEEDEIKQLQKKVLEKQLMEDKPSKQMVVTSTPTSGATTPTPDVAALTTAFQAMAGLMALERAPYQPPSPPAPLVYAEPLYQQSAYMPLSTQPHDLRYGNQGCFNCGRPGHMARHCNLPRQPFQARGRGQWAPRDSGNWQGGRDGQKQGPLQQPSQQQGKYQPVPNPALIPNMAWAGEGGNQ